MIHKLTDRFFVRLPKEEAKAIRSLSEKSGISMSQILRDCIMAQIASGRLTKRIQHKKTLGTDSWNEAQKLAAMDV